MKTQKNSLYRIVIPVLILFIAVAFIIIGVLRNEHSVVLNKAIHICLECIGLGH